jgi:uncharacterized membrane protein YkoI
MKPIRILLLAAMISTGVAYAQNDKMQQSTTHKAKTSTVEANMVPANIQTSFSTKYPNATTVVWYRYVPGQVVPEPGSWYQTMDASDYYTSFTWNDVDYIAWYDNGTWIRSTSRIDDSDLPANIQTIIQNQYPGYIVTQVEVETDRKQTVYEVDLEKADMRYVIHYGADGSVIKKKERKASKTTPMAAMVTDFETRYPHAEEVVWYSYSPRVGYEILPTDWDYNMDASDYEVRFVSDGVTYVSYYDDGAWIRSESNAFDRSKLPTVVSDAISKDYSGYTIVDVDREDKPTQVLYEVELTKGTQKCKVPYGADGAIVKKKCRE